MDSTFLKPVDSSLLDFRDKSSCIQNTIQIYTQDTGFPDLSNVKVVIFGVCDKRGSSDNDFTQISFVSVRRQFYKMYQGDWGIDIADLGDVVQGNTVRDTYFAVIDIISSLVKKNIIPLIIGASQDLTYANYRAYDKLEQTVNLVCVDSRFDLGDMDEDLSSSSFLSKIVMEHPNNLFNYSNLGYQTYYNSQQEINLIDELFFDSYRLGVLNDIQMVEPIMRDADIVSLDMASVRLSDAPGSKFGSPNGFDGNQICAIARYAGISDKLSSFGVYEYDPHLDIDHRTAKLIAQIFWYFIEGVSNRIKDYPFSTKESYFKFVVPLDDDEPINFYKSDKSGRWWMEINIMSDNKFKRHTLIPCVYNDYLSALDQRIPQRWYKAMKKLL